MFTHQGTANLADFFCLLCALEKNPISLLGTLYEFAKVGVADF